MGCLAEWITSALWWGRRRLLRCRCAARELTRPSGRLTTRPKSHRCVARIDLAARASAHQECVESLGSDADASFVSGQFLEPIRDVVRTHGAVVAARIAEEGVHGRTHHLISVHPEPGS